MHDVDKEFLINHGFREDTDKKVLSGLFTNNKKFKEVNISLGITEPSMLLVRSKEKNVTVEVNSVQENRLILKRKLSKEKFSTIFMDILLDEIHNCLFKKYGDDLYQFEFEVGDLRYSLHVSV